MKAKLSIHALLITSTLTFLNACSQMSHVEEDAHVPLKNTANLAQAAFFKHYDAEEVKTYFRTDYIQHNPHVPTGIGPVLSFLPVLQAAQTTYTTHRMLQDRDFIIMHNTYHNAEAFGASDVVTFDIWRMQNGMVAEHWDAISPIVETTASGRTQFDGSTTVRDLDKTEANKALIAQFMEDVLFGKAPEKIDQYISQEHYAQHNPLVKDGLQGLKDALNYLASQNNLFEYQKVHHIFGEGNFVLTQSEGRWNNKPQAFYDLFRIENNKIVEHWDVIQEIPAQMAHSNGMF